MNKKQFKASVSAAVLITDEKDRILLVQQASEKKRHKWGPPAGKLKPNENIFEVAKRETKEETGLDTELMDLVGINTAVRNETKTSVAFIFRGKITGGKLKIKKGEIKDAKYFTKEEIEKLIEENKLYKPLFNGRAIEDYFQGKSYSLNVINTL